MRNTKQRRQVWESIHRLGGHTTADEIAGEIAGIQAGFARSTVYRALDALAESGVEDIVVNTFYLGQMIEDHLKSRKHPRISISRETELLDTGGGVKKMLDFFGGEPFYVLNADIVWTDGKEPALKALADKWDKDRMDLLLLLHPSIKIPGYAGRGDYYLAEGSDKPVFSAKSDKPANYIFAGPRIVHPRLFKGSPEGAFSFLELFHQAEKNGALQPWRRACSSPRFASVRQANAGMTFPSTA